MNKSFYLDKEARLQLNEIKRMLLLNGKKMNDLSFSLIVRLAIKSLYDSLKSFE